MERMFSSAKSFQGDISKWDVSKVINMDYMFMHASSFKQQLCGEAWILSNATKKLMFEGSPGSISRSMCTSTPTIATTAIRAFSPQSKSELKSAINACIRLFPHGQCSDGPHGAIRQWDVSRITDMSLIFEKTTSFNGDVSTWDVSRVEEMNGMFRDAPKFQGDISKWDVSRAVSYTHLTLPTTPYV